MPRMKTRRVTITLPDSLLDRLNDHCAPLERSALISDLLLDYLDTVEEVEAREVRQEARRERVGLIMSKLRSSGRKAADVFLP